PSGGEVYGMFKDGYTLFDAAGAFNEDNLNDRNGHWFFNPETGRYCDTYLAPASENSEHRNDEIHDQFFIYGPDYPTLFAQMNELVGPEPLPEKKAFGFFQTQHVAEHGTQERLMAVARDLRRRGIPCDTLIFDFEWGDAILTDKGARMGEGLEWGPNYREPLEPVAMLAELRAMHFDVMLIYHSAPKFPNRAHQAWTQKEFPEEEWWTQLRERMTEGVRGVWMDTRRNDITDSVIYTGMQKDLGSERRALFMGAYEMFRVRSWDKYPVKRRPWDHLIGARRYPMDWTGDCDYDWDELKWQVRAITNTYGSMRGHSYITSDSMGLDWKIQARWLQFTDFIAFSRSHTAKPWDAGLPSWDFTETIRYDEVAEKTEAPQDTAALDQPSAEASIRKHHLLRYRLLPYLYSHALLNYRTGMPICRPMLLAFPDDSNCNADQWLYQYLFGSELLVAPVCADTASMDIYLPAECRWMDWWDGTLHEGGQVLEYDTSDVEKLPLFVREGGILPMQNECQWIESGQTPDPLNLTIVPPAEGEQTQFDLLEDDGTSLRYQQGEIAVTPITCRNESGTISVQIGPTTGQYRGQPDARSYTVTVRGTVSRPNRIVCNGEELREDLTIQM
ncbi:TIM-barrel domain-containing protein, partial [Verrucomicrobiota bacterium]